MQPNPVVWFEINVEDLARASQFYETVLGGKVRMSKTAIGPHGFIALCFDTEGRLFGLHSVK